VLSRADHSTVRNLMSGNKVVHLKDALNAIVSAFPEISQDDVPECARERILELRRVLRVLKCEDVVRPTSVASIVDDDVDDDNGDVRQARKELLLNGEERALVKTMLQIPNDARTPMQRDALREVQKSSPQLYKHLLKEIEKEAAQPASQVALADPVAASVAPERTWVDPPAKSGTSLLGGRGLPGWKRPLRFDPLSADNNAIYIGLVSYRDPQCGDSLYDAFARAANPERVMIGVVQQNRATDLDCFETYCAKAGAKCRPNQVRVIRMKDTEAQGVMFARWLASSLWSGERWYLQVDAHSSFNYEWDEMVLKSILSLNDERAVLSHHPPDMKLWPNGMGNNVINICKYKWDDGGLPRFSSIMANKAFQKLTTPFPGIFIGAGMVFGRAQWVIDCPFDPNLLFLFR
jgi:hypothetical protein